MLRFLAPLLIINTLIGVAYAQQPPPELVRSCEEKYLTAQATDMIGSISEGDFLKVCIFSASVGTRAPSKKNKSLPPEVQSSIDNETKSCGETVKMEDSFILRRDVNGDGIDDFILDFGGFICGKNHSSDYCGSGGCLTQVFASLSEKKFVKAYGGLVHSIKFSKVRGRPALTLALHGSACGKAGVAACGKTLFWNGQKFSP